MPAAAVAPGTVVDTAGTATITPTNATVRIGGSLALTIGDVVSSHSSGAITHPANTISTGSATVRINGKGVAYSGSVAACGGPVSTTFVATVLIGA